MVWQYNRPVRWCISFVAIACSFACGHLLGADSDEEPPRRVDTTDAAADVSADVDVSADGSTDAITSTTDAGGCSVPCMGTQVACRHPMTASPSGSLVLSGGTYSSAGLVLPALEHLDFNDSMGADRTWEAYLDFVVERPSANGIANLAATASTGNLMTYDVRWQVGVQNGNPLSTVAWEGPQGGSFKNGVTPSPDQQAHRLTFHVSATPLGTTVQVAIDCGALVTVLGVANESIGSNGSLALQVAAQDSALTIRDFTMWYAHSP